MTDKKKLILYVVGFFLLSCITGLAAYGYYTNTHKTNAIVQPTSTQKIDPITKQVIDNGASQTPENYGVNPAAPSMIGFATMLDQGVTQTDLTAFQGGISNYFVTNASSYPPSSVVVLSDASCGFPASDGTVSCTYTLTVNDKTKLQGSFSTDEAGHITIGISSNSKSIYTTSITESTS